MEIYQIAAVAAAVCAALILAVRMIREKRKAEGKEKGRRKLPDPGKDKEQKRIGRLPHAQTAELSCESSEENEAECTRTNTCDSGRTMLLSYTTLILTDVEHPSRKYRAELFYPVTVGREKECDIVLEEASVSRKHLRIYREGALIYAENLSRVNRTLLNGRLIKTPSELVSGSRLQIGRYCFQVEID